jgi:hypothetical protein
MESAVLHNLRDGFGVVFVLGIYPLHHVCYDVF